MITAESTEFTENKNFLRVLYVLRGGKDNS
jgi:hypothetical protein